jgi:hypothetical protein
LANPETTDDSPAYVDLNTVPFVYFDMASAHGILAGAIQVELAARTLNPLAGGGVEVKYVTVARVRCSPLAATHLRNALDAALKMLEQPQQPNPVAASQLN